MSKLDSRNVAVLVQKAFCLEALADKQDCTSRYIDLPGKPLEDFIIAGLNAGEIFRQVADDWVTGERRIYKHYIAALKASQINKSSKYINFGLLEIMFPTVAARLNCNEPSKVVGEIVKVMQNGNNRDVKDMIAARQLAWSSSTKRELKLSELTPKVRAATIPYEFYQLITQVPNLGSSAYQWSKHYEDGLPLLQAQYDHLQKTKGPILDRLKTGFDPLRRSNPEIKVGILADMCAAALFLHLSFQV